ncbi:MAG: glycoside hydrolase family 3 protein [Ilumatobacter sp.]|nr:glycoside hydrolase family 3 protein [Ilumatobacter sp.]
MSGPNKNRSIFFVAAGVLLASVLAVHNPSTPDASAAPPCGTPRGGPCPTTTTTTTPTSSTTTTTTVPPTPQCISPQDCLSQLTLDEKIGQMTQANHLALDSNQDIADYHLGSLLAGGGGAPSTGNTPQDWADMVDTYQAVALSGRLGIPIIFGVDAVHGHSNVYGTTIFPHNLGLGATRNPALAQQIGEVTAKEVYATGIPWTFSPCLCVARDERWGRTYESFGEDPEIAAMMTTYIDGLQGADLSAQNTVLATAKHWVGDGGTVGGDDQGDTVLSEADLRAIHVAPFVDAIARGVGSVMPSYSSWNGEKLHGQQYLLTDVLKTELGFDGFVISDWAAIDQLPGDYNSDVRVSINAGIDMVMVPNNYQLFQDTLRTEIQAGNIPMARIDDAVTKILEAKFALGLFDQPFSDRTFIGDIGSPAHRAVARQAVRESLVLLENDGVLPLPKATGEILVAGANADDIGNQSGGWTISWQGSSGDTTIGTTILEAVQATVDPGTTVTYNERATGRITGDFGIVVVGEQPYAEGQGDDQHLGLSAGDTNAIDRVCSAMPCVVVLVSGRPMLIADLLPTTNAFVAAWLPGTEGEGVADVLFGDFDFTGTLPITWPRDMAQIPINVGDATYDPLFAYGHGLTYGP